jgi:predicted ATPase/signal transduction histidine kinase
MLNLHGYQETKLIYTGTRTEVYGAIQCSTGKPVLVKVLRNPHPSFNELVHFRNQYAIARDLDSPYIVQPIALERYGNGYALVMPDFGAIALREYWQTSSRSLKDFLHIAIQLADALHYLGQQRIIHKDIKPGNILICPQTDQVKLIDFSISSLLPKEEQQLINPNVLEGTLAYISPEQTGRMNRGIDYRTDFYSLGVTFYELLTGELPFTSDDPMELIHCHIAKMPPLLLGNGEQGTGNGEEGSRGRHREQRSRGDKEHSYTLHPTPYTPHPIPQVLANIVMKLMAKNAEERYQSALGLKYDLEICLNQLKTTGEITPFKIGQRDICNRFCIPEKLYGRETEVQALLDAFERVANPPESILNQDINQDISDQEKYSGVEMMLIAGFSGIGKTAVINEVHKPIVKQRGYFIRGKFDQFNRNIPFSAIVQAFRDLIEQLQGESDTELNKWKNKILQALGVQGQAIIDVIPELESIIGPQPPIAELSGNAAQNRFNLLFGKFIQIFTAPEHPLVIFLDDLQWADPASLKLLKLLMSESEAGYLLILGAYRDNEVFPAHPLMLTLAELATNSAMISTITLQPLRFDHINQLVADTLLCSPEVANPLSELIYQKTQGNPFFTAQFLQGLYQDQLLKFNHQLNFWECDMSQVRAASLTDDVVEFMAGRLQKLPEKTQQVLQLAACVGNQFELETLAVVCEASAAEVAQSLWGALQEGLMLPLSEAYKFFHDWQREDKSTAIGAVGYRFLHDRVQQAAYSLIPPDQKQATHLKIGQLLLKSYQGDEREDRLFDIVNQLNTGRNLIIEKADKNQLAQLNLQAGRKAKAATAYGAALEYLTTAIALLSPDSWQTEYHLTLALYTEAIAASYLNANFEQAEQYSTAVLQRVDNILDTVAIYELKLNQKIADRKADEALEIGLQILNSLGISRQDILDYGQQEVILPQVEDLAKAPEMTDPYLLASMRLLICLTSAATIAKPELLLPLILTQVHLSLAGGNSRLTAFCYGWYGSLLCGHLGEIDQGYQAGQIALELLERFDCTSIQCQVMTVVYLFVYPWKTSLRQVLNPALESFKLGLETGDILYGSYSIFNYCVDLLLSGHNLEEVIAQQRFYIQALQKQRIEYSVSLINFWQYLALRLTGESGDELYQSLKNTINEVGAWGFYTLYLVEGILLYLESDYPASAARFVQAKEFESAVGGWPPIALHNFYNSLSLLALFPEVDPTVQGEYLAQVTVNQAKMREWAEYAPMNYQHKYDLVAAEQYRILNNKTEAIALYDRAIIGAQENQYLPEEALANELAAKFYLEWGKAKVAAAYMQEAYYCYARWGAKAKTEKLKTKYPQLLAPILQASPGVFNPSYGQNSSESSSTVTTIASALDLTSAIKASRAISEEIELDILLGKLMQIVLENAGAGKGALILNNGGNWQIATWCVNGQCNLVNIPLDETDNLPISIINTVKRTQKIVLINDLKQDRNFTGDNYLMEQPPKSLCCTPILSQGKLIGILYLENRLTIGAFTPNRIELLNLLMAQAAISIENARLYHRLEDYSRNLEVQVAERTEELQQKNQDLEKALQQLQQTQTQLIQTEKMSSLGQMVAGIAHEINNPINFIAGNLQHARDYCQDLLELVDLYEQENSQPSQKIQDKMAEIELDYLREDLSHLFASMQHGSDRIRKIILGLRNFSRLDEAEYKLVDIHEGLDNTLLILQHRLQPQGNRPGIAVPKNYGKLPLVNCYANQLNQVFFNLLSNAIDVLKSGESHQSPEIRITTEVSANKTVKISIADNGPGISENVRQKIFDPFFTTKPVGQGTGLGLSICHQIITEKHGGQLSCISQPGQGAEFIIEIPI